MNGRKWLAWIAAVLAAACAGAGAAESSVTLRTVSCFAGTDAAADAYVEILQQYESETGNTVLDNSSTSDEAWKTSVLKDFAAGTEPDILFFFAAGADSAPLLSRVVSLEEINAAYNAASAELGIMLSRVGEAWWAEMDAHPEVDLFCPDGGHASPAGAEVIARTLWESLKKAMEADT